jgi:prepilin-type N-terminal cleavage/methylation domain-containing protein
MMRSRQNAFTLVELLVVIAIIGILVSMMLPAIQATRETARRTECTSQLSRLILAVQDYQSSHEVFPIGTTNPTGPIQNLPNGEHISWIARILPYIDEPVLYDNLDLSRSAYSKKNDRGRQVTVPILICPSCPASLWPYSNYAGCHNDIEAPIDVNNRGVLFLNSQITRDDLRDGAAYMLFLGEKLPDEYDLGWLSGTPATLRNVGTPLNQMVPNGIADSAPPWVHTEAISRTEQTPNPEKEVLPSESDASEMLPSSQQGGNKALPLAVGGFASGHVSGANMALGDGSVRFITDVCSPSVLARLANRADSQIIDGTEF